MWRSKKLQNRVRFQIAAVRLSTSDVVNEEHRGYREQNYGVPNDFRYYKENNRWMFPVAMRAASSHNLDSRRSDKNEDDVILDPHLTSRDIADALAIQLGGSFHVTTIGKIPSIMKHGILPGGLQEGKFILQQFAPWDQESQRITFQ